MADMGLKYTNEGLPKNWDGKDWQTYKWAMLTVFEETGLLDIVNGTRTRDTVKSREAEDLYDKQQLKAKRYIGTSVPPKIHKQINHVNTAPQMWTALVEIYEGMNNEIMQAHMIRRLLKELDTMKLKPGGDANLHCSEMFSKRTELLDLRFEVNPIQMVNYMIKSLPSQPEFEHLEWSVLNGSDGSIRDPDVVRAKIRLAAARQAERDSSSRSERRQGGNNNGAGAGNSNSGNRGHGNARQETTEDQAGQTNTQKKKGGCWICGSQEHMKRACPERDKPKQQQSRANCTKIVTAEKKARRGDALHLQPGVVAGYDNHSVDDNNSDEETRGNQASEHEPTREWWCFDTGTNVHLTGNKDHFVMLNKITTADSRVCGVAHRAGAKVEGIGTVCLTTMYDDQEIVFFLDDVFCVPDAEHGLLSPGHAAQQGYSVEYDPASEAFSMTMKGKPVLKAVSEHGVWGFYSMKENKNEKHDKVIINYAHVDGVASLQLWHERMGHVNEQYIKTMVDRGLVTGMMLTKRQHHDCEACHLGKQRQQRHGKKAQHSFTAPNEIVYADLMFPSKNNATKYAAVLVIMDGYSRYLTAHLLTSKDAKTVNPLMMQYVVWAERQAGRGIKKIISRDYTVMEGHRLLPVQQVLTDKGGEFINAEMAAWYKARGIEHIKVGPKSSHLNPCERQHQTIGEMTKTLMREAGLPKSFWPDALEYAVYLKNRVYNKTADATPFEKLFGIKPDLHHIRKFGCLVFPHVPNTPDRHREDDNAKIGFLLGLKDDVVGYKVYYPEEHTKKWVPDLRVNESIVYRDRHAVDQSDLEDVESLHFYKVHATISDIAAQDLDLIRAATEYAGDDETGLIASVKGDQESFTVDLGDRAPVLEVDGYEFVDRPVHKAQYPSSQNATAIANLMEEEKASEYSGGDSVSTAGEHGSESHEADDGETEEEQGSDMEDIPVEPYSMHGPAERKRAVRDETSTEAAQEVANKKRPCRTGLREASLRTRPKRFENFVVFATGVRILDAYGKPIGANEVKIPRSYREAMRSKWASFWSLAALEEFSSLQSKGVMEEIPEGDMPDFAKAIKTMWVWAYKTDQQGYIVRFKARLVALGNWQRAGFDFAETFSPVARMASCRMVLGIAGAFDLDVFGADINTAYLNAELKIPQYIKGIEGFPCVKTGTVYVLRKALYGLRQAGREWNDELNAWMISQDFMRCATEPCLYYKLHEREIMLVLVYVNDILCATNNPSAKVKLFADLHERYGIKDQGLLTDYLGIEVTQTESEIAISQVKYTQEILDQFGFGDDGVHSCGNPMETNATLQPGKEGDEYDHEFDYRGAVGKLMYLATCTRPDLAYVVGQLCRFNAAPTKQHVGTVKRVLRYLVGTKNHGIHYHRDKERSLGEINLEGYCDSDWGRDPETRKSTTGFVITLAGGAIAWMSRRQSIVALSTAEAEYVAACEAVMEVAAERNILQEVLPQYKTNVKIGIDSQSAHVLATDPTYSRRTRHIELRWHFIREQVRRGAVLLHKIPGIDNPADEFTKPLDKKRLMRLSSYIGLMKVQSNRFEEGVLERRLDQVGLHP